MLAAVALIMLLWPGGLLVMTTAWVDPANAAAIRGHAIVVGRPWWLVGYWPVLAWSTVDGDAPAPRNNGEVEQYTISIVSTDSPWLWKLRPTSSGRLAVTPVPPVRAIPELEWQAMLRAYAQQIARDSAKASAEQGGMSIYATTPPWTIEASAP